MCEQPSREPIWDIRGTRHRAGLLILIVVYLVLLILLIYGNAVSRRPVLPARPVNIGPLIR